MHIYFYRAAAMAAALSLAGCAALPRERGYREASDLVQARRGTAPGWTADAFTAPEMPATAVGPADAVRLALQHHPRVRQAYVHSLLVSQKAERSEHRELGMLPASMPKAARQTRHRAPPALPSLCEGRE